MFLFFKKQKFMEVKKNNYYNILENSLKNVAVRLCRWQES